MPASDALLTDRLVMREFRDADREPFAAMNADPQVMQHFLRPMTREESDACVDRIRARFAEHGWGLWALERRYTGEFIGFTGLASPDFDAEFTPAVEVGWRLAATHWGLGFATEAARRALRYGFDTLALPEIVSFTAVTNTPSQRVMQRIGMRRDRDFEHPGVPEGNPLRPHVLYRLTTSEWRAGPCG